MIGMQNRKLKEAEEKRLLKENKEKARLERAKELEEKRAKEKQSLRRYRIIAWSVALVGAIMLALFVYLSDNYSAFDRSDFAPIMCIGGALLLVFGLVAGIFLAFTE